MEYVKALITGLFFGFCVGVFVTVCLLNSREPYN